MSKEWTLYSDIEKGRALAVLDSNGGNVKRTAEEIGVPRKTLEAWSKDRGLSPDVAMLRHEEKETLIGLLEEAARETIKSITSDIKNGKGELKDKSITAAILMDKFQLLSGAPTSRTESGSPADYNSLLCDSRAKRHLRKVG